VKKSSWIVILFGIAIVAALWFTTLGNQKYRCEVCLTFRGQKVCRTAAASNKETAQRTATENACAQVEQSMTDRFNCPGTPPDSVKWLTGR
jgi:hypothetical protein